MVSFILSIMFLSILPCIAIMMVVKGIWRNINKNVSSIKYYLKYPFYMNYIIIVSNNQMPTNIIKFDMSACIETLTISWNATYNDKTHYITKIDWHVIYRTYSSYYVKLLFTNKQDALAFKLEFM